MLFTSFCLEKVKSPLIFGEQLPDNFASFYLLEELRFF